jgi:glycosyltransferase involved in cell wall biosynthesis
MICGGVEKALINLLDLLDEKIYQVDLYLLKKEGEFLKYVPNWVNIKEIIMPEKARNTLLDHIGFKKALLREAKKGRLHKVSYMLYRKVIKKDYFAEVRKDINRVEEVNQSYDIAICFHCHSPYLINFVADKVRAKRKYLWAHNDFSTTNFAIELFLTELQKYHHLFAVSSQVAEEFAVRVPELKSRIEVFPNIISPVAICKQAEEFFPNEFAQTDLDTIRIVSVGRLEKQKGFDVAIQAAVRLKLTGLKIKWFILGEGRERPRLERMIAEENLEDSFFLIGIRHNPYPYIKNCNIYVQPSRHEGYGLAVAEARVLKKPIISTDFAGAREQIVDRQTGIIVSCNDKEIAHGILLLCEKPELKDKIISGLKNAKEEFLEANKTKVGQYF